MALGVPSYIDVESLVFRHGFIRTVSTHMIFTNMGSIVAIFFKSFRNSDS